MALAPLKAGALKLTLAWACPAVAVPIMGAPGMVKGTTVLDAAEDGPVPASLVALTVKL
jgi:hypothetical protein